MSITGKEKIEMTLTFNRTWDRDYADMESAKYTALADEVIGLVRKIDCKLTLKVLNF